MQRLPQGKGGGIIAPQDRIGCDETSEPHPHPDYPGGARKLARVICGRARIISQIGQCHIVWVSG